MKTLYLLRHAKAESGTKDISDLERKLAARGKEACILVGQYMKNKGYAPGLVLTSPSARTRETSVRVSEAAGQKPAEQVIDKLYLAAPEEMLHYLHLVHAEVNSVMLIGHNPGMHHLALDMAKGEDTPLRHQLELKYPTAALAVLRFDCERWSEVRLGQGELVDFLTPAEI